MRPRPPHWIAIAGWACGAVACASPPSKGPRDRGQWETERGPEPEAPKKVFGPWERFDEIGSFQPLGSPQPSDHLGGDLFGQLLLDDKARAYGSVGRPHPLPPGATLTLALRAMGEEEPDVFFVMTKRPAGYDREGDDWEYLIVRPDGTVEDRGKLALCARCHADGPREHLFENWRSP